MSALVTLEGIFRLIGLILFLLVLMTLKDRSNPKRLTTALFWGLIAFDFLFDELLVLAVGKPLAHRLIGASVVLMAVIAGCRGLGQGRHDLPPAAALRALAARWGNRIFLPALTIPLVTVLCTVGLKNVAIGGTVLLDPRNLTVASLAVAVVLASLLAWGLLGGTPLQAVRESRRLIDAIGWAGMLPQMLALLGGVFVVAKTGDSIKLLTLLVAPHDSRFAMVAIYCLGMALFTMVMGNAFAAFPVMTAGIALPILLKDFGGNPAPLVAIGMYSGYCGTLMTPMAANFNIVPAALLELKDKYGVIRVQMPTALLLLATNIVLMYVLAFR